MNPQSRDTVTFLMGTLLSLITLLGLLTRYVLLPYLREHLVAPVKETHQAVTENHHSSPQAPTVVDRLEDLHTDVRTLTRLLDLHTSWSDREHRAIRRELAEAKSREGDTDEQRPGT